MRAGGTFGLEEVDDMTKHVPWAVMTLALGGMAIASCTTHPTAAVMKPTGEVAKAANGKSKVPVMTPTGDAKPAVDPNNPAKPAAPVAPK
jgi:hypothetical protein